MPSIFDFLRREGPVDSMPGETFRHWAGDTETKGEATARRAERELAKKDMPRLSNEALDRIRTAIDNELSAKPPSQSSTSSGSSGSMFRGGVGSGGGGDIEDALKPKGMQRKRVM